MNLVEAIGDPRLFASWFRDPASWAAWRTFLGALFGHALTDEQAAVYRECTGRTILPIEPFREAVLIVGRRGGKSFIVALIGVFLATFKSYSLYLQPGERATVMIVAADRRQARVIFRYIKGLLNNMPSLGRKVQRETADSFDLDNDVTIEVGTASYRSIRGYTFAAVLADEVAFWRTDDDAAEPDSEILAAVRPGLATIPSSMLLIASSPYARRGVLWDAWRRYHGKDDASVLCWQAPTTVMNPSVPASVISEATERDPASAAAEYGAQFRTDVEALLSREAVEAVVAHGVRERAPLSGIRYSGFVDPSGGSADSMTLAVGHREDDRAILDAVRERKPPFSPEDVVAEFADLLKSYRISNVVGDRYAGEWPKEGFKKQGITYSASAKPKSDLYRDMLPKVNSGKVDLLDIDRLTNQLVGLERRTARGGRDSIDHAPGGHDDVANAVAGVLAQITFGRSYNLLAAVGGAEDETRERPRNPAILSF